MVDGPFIGPTRGVEARGCNDVAAGAPHIEARPEQARAVADLTCEQALSSSAYSDKGDVAAEPGLIGEFKPELPEQRLSVGTVHYSVSDSLA